MVNQLSKTRPTKPVALMNDKLERFLSELYRDSTRYVRHNRRIYAKHREVHEQELLEYKQRVDAHMEAEAQREVEPQGVQVQLQPAHIRIGTLGYEEFGFIVGEALYELINRVLTVMPYLDVFPRIRDRAEKYKNPLARVFDSVVFIQRGQDFPSGWLRVSGSRDDPKVEVWSPITDSQGGGRTTHDKTRALQLCRSAFKYTPPVKAASFVEMCCAADAPFHTTVRNVYKTYNRKLAVMKEYMGDRTIGAEVFEILERMHTAGHRFKTDLNDKFDGVYEARTWLAENEKAQECWMYLRMLPNARCRYCFGYKNENDFAHWGIAIYALPQYKDVSDTYDAPINSLPPEVVAAMSQLAMSENDELVDHVGVKLSRDEYLLFATGAEKLLDMDRRVE